MNYNDLVGPKSKDGSIQQWVRYKPVPVQVILEETQALIYSNLRVREMRAGVRMTVPLGAFALPLPADYLDPISMQDREGINLIPMGYVSEDQMLRSRTYDTDIVTTLVGSLTPTATFLTVSSAANFPTTGVFSIVIDDEIMLVTTGQGTTAWTVTRAFQGSIAAAHSAGATVDGMLEDGTATMVAVWNETFQFNFKADELRTVDLVYFKRPALLSATNTTNFLTRRYPNLVRVGSRAAAASYMKDAAEYQQTEAELLALIQSINAEADLGKAA